MLKIIMPKSIAETMGKYHVICVTSEVSKLREYVAQIPDAYKIQWIHTDYASWSNFNGYTRWVTTHDRETYSAYDQIVLISESSLRGFITKFPEFESKSRAIPNLIEIKAGACESHVHQKSSTVRILSAARLEDEKDIPRMIRVAARLKAANLDYKWTVIGGGSKFDYCVSMIKAAGIEDCFILRGYQENPYPFFVDADLFALFSHYEGLPNTIFESFILGTPVIATRVGGIPEQVSDGINGILVDDYEDDIFEKLSFLIANPGKVDFLRNNLRNYHYDNSVIIEKVKEVLLLT